MTLSATTLNNYLTAVQNNTPGAVEAYYDYLSTNNIIMEQ